MKYVLILAAALMASCNASDNNGKMSPGQQSEESAASYHAAPDSEAQEAGNGSITSPGTYPEAFVLFREAMLEKNKEKLASVCRFPVANSADFDDPKPFDRSDVSRIFGMLNGFDTQVLRLYEPGGKEVKVREGDYCNHMAHESVSENGEQVDWGVGCQQLISDEIGEYAVIFRFQKVGARFLLVEILAAG
jgi:hypothetical protein